MSSHLHPSFGFVLDISSHYEAQDGPKLMSLLPLLPRCKGDRCAPAPLVVSFEGAMFPTGSLLAVFEKMVEPTGSGASLEKVGNGGAGQAFSCYSMVPFPVHSLLPELRFKTMTSNLLFLPPCLPCQLPRLPHHGRTIPLKP